MLSILTRRCTDDFLETARQMALTTKPNLDRCLCQRFASFDEALRLTNTHAFQIGVGRHADFGAKDTQKVVRTERNVLSQFM